MCRARVLLIVVLILEGCVCSLTNNGICDSLIREIIATDNSSKPGLPYSHAVRVDHTLYFSGTLGRDPETGKFAEGITKQTHQALKNVGDILKAAKTDYTKVVKTTVFLANITDFQEVNEIYKQYFIENYPARSALQAAALPLGALVEIEGIAVVGNLVTA